MKGWIRRALIGLGSAVGVVVLAAAAAVAWGLAVWDRPVARSVMPLVAPKTEAAIARGRYLYTYTAACWTCHGANDGATPDTAQSGGRMFDARDIGPGFGIFYASNLTADDETGIGRWADGELVRALREGVSRDGRVLFPLMVFPMFHGMSDDDALAIVAYMRTFPPVRNTIPQRVLTVPGKLLFAFGMIKPEPQLIGRVDAPRAGVTPEYGKYLAWHVSGCAECHMSRSPKDGSFDLSRPMAGGLFELPEEFVRITGSNLTPHPRTGLGAWSEEQFLTAMRSGTRPDGTVMPTLMPWPVYGQWADEDLRAVWAYLRTLQPVDHATPRARLVGAAAGPEGPERGDGLYRVYCQTCHGEAGHGTQLTSRVLVDRIVNDDRDSVADTIARGFGPRKPTMPAFGKTLDAEQIEDIIEALRPASRLVGASR